MEEQPKNKLTVHSQITMAELSKVENAAIDLKQASIILRKTPSKNIRTRPAKGGGTWKYVTGVYIKKVLNLAFGWDWSFEVKEYKIEPFFGQAYVLGRLTVNSNGKTIVKEQFGRVDIKFKKEPDAHGNRIPLDVGNDLKAATTDALKKCAAELGIASDVYAPAEFKEIEFNTPAANQNTDDWDKQQVRLKDFILQATNIKQLEDLEADGIEFSQDNWELLKTKKSQL
jgi:hypothetical protein